MKKIPKTVIELKYWTTALYDILELNKDFVPHKSDRWKIDSESLVQKEACHALSVLDLLEGTKPNISTIKSEINFIDYSSIYSVVRSAIETYLVFSYIFIDPKVGVRVKKLRHKIWKASSLSQRQRHLSLSNKTDALLRIEKKQFLKLRREILKSKTLDLVSIHRIKNLEKKRPFDWKPQYGWRKIAKDSILSERYWLEIYNLLSSVVHSNAVISNHFSSKNPKNIQETNALTATSFLNHIIPLFIDGYTKLFPKIKYHLKLNSKLRFNIEIAKGIVSGYGKGNLI